MSIDQISEDFQRAEKEYFKSLEDEDVVYQKLLSKVVSVLQCVAVCCSLLQCGVGVRSW